MIESTGTSNRLDTLDQMRGEIVKGVVSESREGGRVIHVIFESGFALTWHNSTGGYWITSRDDVRRIINKIKDDAAKAHGDLQNILKMAGEHP